MSENVIWSGRQADHRTQRPGFIQIRVQWKLNVDSGTGTSRLNRDGNGFVNKVHSRHGWVVASAGRKCHNQIQIARRCGRQDDFNVDLVTSARAILKKPNCRP